MSIIDEGLAAGPADQTPAVAPAAPRAGVLRRVLRKPVAMGPLLTMIGKMAAQSPGGDVILS